MQNTQAMVTDARVVVSVVSHGQGALVHQLLLDLARHESQTVMAAIVTCNIAESLPFDAAGFPFPVHVLANASPQGFAANHNAAFRWCRARPIDTRFFCVINPDIRLPAPVFSPLCAQLTASNLGLVAPLVRNGAGDIEDSIRRVPTPLRVLQRILGWAPRLDYKFGEGDVIFPDWVAGMFMLVPGPVFAAMNGFDDRYFLYYEDVDLCCRLRVAGYRLAADTRVSVVHDARRTSHRNVKYLRWHLASMLRFFLSASFRHCRRRPKAPCDRHV